MYPSRTFCLFFLHSKPWMSVTGSRAQTYKTCQDLKKTQDMHICNIIYFIYYQIHKAKHFFSHNIVDLVNVRCTYLWYEYSLYIYIRSIDCASISTIFRSIRFRKCSDSVVFIVFQMYVLSHFWYNWHYTLNKNISKHENLCNFAK